MADARTIEFRERTKKYAVAVIHFCSELPNERGIHNLVNQLIRSSGSVAANFREACRARSSPKFISKLEICIQEADESMLWLELMEEGYNLKSEMTTTLITEANELIAILVTMTRTAKARRAS
jgi:four helix bundle protein